MDPITSKLKEHYSHKFELHGASPRGVDWANEEDVWLRYEKMLDVIPRQTIDRNEPVSLLDVGCGYGGLYLYAKRLGIPVRYTGIDVAENMIAYADAEIRGAEFYCADVFTFAPQDRFDFVVCSGILTQKLTASIRDMDIYAQRLIKRLFELCGQGVAFNVMTTKVNFMVDNLYYRNPVELFAFCLTEVSAKIRIDHAYPLYEYTIYLHR